MWEKRNRCKQSEAKPAAARSEPGRNSEAHSSGDDMRRGRELGRERTKKHAPICFGSAPSVSHPAWLSSKATGSASGGTAGSWEVLSPGWAQRCPAGTGAKGSSAFPPVPQLCSLGLESGPRGSGSSNLVWPNSSDSTKCHGQLPMCQEPPAWLSTHPQGACSPPAKAATGKLLPHSGPQFLLQCHEEHENCTLEMEKAWGRGR